MQAVLSVNGPDNQHQQTHEAKRGKQQRQSGHDQQLEEVGFLLLQLHDDQTQPRFHHFDQQRDDALTNGENALTRSLRVLSIRHNQRRDSRTPSTSPTAAPIPTPVHGFSRT